MKTTFKFQGNFYKQTKGAHRKPSLLIFVGEVGKTTVFGSTCHQGRNFIVQRVISYTSNDSFQHKTVAFYQMVHKVHNIPLSEDGKAKELEYIFEMARMNGYKERTFLFVGKVKPLD